MIRLNMAFLLCFLSLSVAAMYDANKKESLLHNLEKDILCNGFGIKVTYDGKTFFIRDAAFQSYQSNKFKRLDNPQEILVESVAPVDVDTMKIFTLQFPAKFNSKSFQASLRIEMRSNDQNDDEIIDRPAELHDLICCVDESYELPNIEI